MSKTHIVFLDENGSPLSQKDASALVRQWKMHEMPAKKSSKSKTAKTKSAKAKTAKKAKVAKAKPAKKAKAKKSTKSKCVSKGRNTCGDEEYCYTETGDCVGRYATGAPKGGTKMREDLGDDFFYDEENGFVGRREDVLAAVSQLKAKKVAKVKAPKKVAKVKAPKKVAKVKKAKQTCYDEEDPSLCNEGDVCNIATGRCVKSTGTAAKGKWKLEVDGRIIVGDEEALTRLQETLGGDLSAPLAAKRGRPPKAEVKAPKTKAKKAKEPVKTKKTKTTKVKARSCADVEDPIECGFEDICNADTGRCVSDTAKARKNLWKLIVDGRIIVGARNTLLPLQEALGGEVTRADVEEEEIVVEEETEPIEAPKKKKGKGVTTLPVVAAPQPAAAPRPPLVKLTSKKEEIRRAFERCLQGLGE